MDYAVKVEDVYKEYPFYQHVTAGIKSFLFHLPKSIASLRKTRFIALNGVSFEIGKGETFGIIGRNGSGKSTILGLIAGVLKQDRGRVQTNGRISSLLELGSGFHPDLSGIENIIMNGILMGNTKQEMLKKADEIIEFSELGDFIYQPLRTYSSGMQMRLGFSVAVHIDPEILLVDEALAVGDMDFQEKSMKKMKEFRRLGATIVIVSHDMSAVAKLCDKVMWIDSGSVMAMGKSEEVIPEYLNNRGIEIDLSFTRNRSLSVKEEASEEVQKAFSGETLIPADNKVLSDPYIKPISWWDYPAIMHQCENFITGDPNIHFYEYLRKTHGIESFGKGLSICRRLKGIEENFMRYHVCNSFDVISDAEEITNLLSGAWGFQVGSYDLFLSIDVLSHIENLKRFIKDMGRALKDGGVIVAMEYLGPAHFQRSAKELEIAEMFYNAFTNGDTRDYKNVASLPVSYQQDIIDPINSESVIPCLEKDFDAVSVKYFAGPLYDLVLNKILERFEPTAERDSLIKTVIQCERILVEENILENNYAMIVAKKGFAD